MKLLQAIGKLAKQPLELYNPITSTWDSHSVPVVLEASARWISARKEFFNRRVILTSAPIPNTYRVCRIQGEAREYLLYFMQPNFERGENYLYEYTALDSDGSIDVIELQTTLSASGIPSAATEVVVGTYPHTLTRYASNSSEVAESVVHTKSFVFLPGYAAVTTSHKLKRDGGVLEIQEVQRELDLLRVMVKEK